MFVAQNAKVNYQAQATYHLNRAIANAALELWKDAEAHPKLQP